MLALATIVNDKKPPRREAHGQLKTLIGLETDQVRFVFSPEGIDHRTLDRPSHGGPVSGQDDHPADPADDYPQILPVAFLDYGSFHRPRPHSSPPTHPIAERVATPLHTHNSVLWRRSVNESDSLKVRNDSSDNSNEADNPLTTVCDCASLDDSASNPACASFSKVCNLVESALKIDASFERVAKRSSSVCQLLDEVVASTGTPSLVGEDGSCADE
jgi:hypothetical protein